MRIILKISILISLGLQLAGAFFLASQIVPKTWPERLESNFQKKYQNLLKIRQMKKRQLLNAKLRIFEKIGKIGGYRGILQHIPGMLLLPVVYGVEIIRSLLKGQVLTRERWMRLIVVFLASMEVYIVAGRLSLISVFSLCVLYLSFGLEMVSIRVQRATYLSVERIVWFFSRKQGEEIFALLGISLLAVGFIIQAVVNWIGIK